MNRRDQRALTVIIGAAVVCGLFMMNQRMQRARTAADHALAQHAQTLLQCRQLVHLQSQEQLIDDAAAPEPDLIASLEVQLAASGITSAIDRFRMGAPQPVRDTPYQRQVATVTIQSVPPPTLATFLTNWTDAEPRWVVRSVTLDHPKVERRRDRPGQWDAVGRYTVQITLENTFLAGPSGTRDLP